MYRFIIKIVKYVSLGIMPFVLISNAGDEIDYGFTEVINHDLIPNQLDFGFQSEKSETGTIINSLNLVFTDTRYNGRMELVMRIPNGGTERYNGEYQVGKVDGFLNGFEGIFGYFTHNDYGEKPFFANSGIVRILSLEDNRIQGYMDVTLVNDYGKKIRISDTFRNY